MANMNKDGATGPEIGMTHFPVAVLYSNLPGPKPHPFFECACGYQTGINPNWQNAGDDFDEHLKENSPGG